MPRLQSALPILKHKFNKGSEVTAEHGAGKWRCGPGNGMVGNRAHVKHPLQLQIVRQFEWRAGSNEGDSIHHVPLLPFHLQRVVCEDVCLGHVDLAIVEGALWVEPCRTSCQIPPAPMAPIRFIFLFFTFFVMNLVEATNLGEVWIIFFDI